MKGIISLVYGTELKSSYALNRGEMRRGYIHIMNSFTSPVARKKTRMR